MIDLKTDELTYIRKLVKADLKTLGSLKVSTHTHEVMLKYRQKLLKKIEQQIT